MKELILNIIATVAAMIGGLFLLLAAITEWANNAKGRTATFDGRMWLTCGGIALVAFLIAYFAWR